MRKCPLIFSLLVFLVPSTPAWADAGQFYLAPGLQWMEFDEESTNLDDDVGYFLGLGYEVTDQLGFELSTFDLDPDPNTGSSGSFDIDNTKLDVLYYLNTNRISPFVVGGLGNANFNGENTTQLDLGVGLRVKLTDNVVWRTALRSFNYQDRDHEDRDMGIDSSLVFYFGGREQPQQTASTSAPAPIPEPAPPADSDSDGVPDSRDQCPDTPMNYAVDNQGCPIPVEEVARVELLVNFELESAEVRPQFFDEIEEVADFMEQYPDVVVELEGHTDNSGPSEFNQNLSERRAEAVGAVLVNEFDIQASRVTAVGYGEEQPMVSNDTRAGRQQNRRVITVIIKTLQRYQPR